MPQRVSQLGSFLLSLTAVLCMTVNARACDDRSALEKLRDYAHATFAKVSPRENDTPMVTGKENFAGLRDYAGFCADPNHQNSLRGKKVDTYHLMIRDEAAAAFDRYQQNHPGQPWRRYDGQPLNVTDFVAIDAMARTLMGEMGNEGFCGKGYMAAAARVIMNRGIQLLNHPERYARMFGSGKRCTDFSQCVANAALMSKQFSVWNKLPHDKNKAQAMAHSKNRGQKNKGLSDLAADHSQESVTGTALCPKRLKTPAQTKSWNDAVELATIAITAPWQMKNITPDIHAMWYTSAMAMCGGTHLPDGHAYGQLLNKDSCIELWDDNGKCVRHKGGSKKSAAKAPAKKKKK